MTLVNKRKCLTAAKKYLRHTYNKDGCSFYHHFYLSEDRDFLYFGNGHIFFQVEADSWGAKELISNPPKGFDVLKNGDNNSDYVGFFHNADTLFDGRNEPCNKTVVMYALRDEVSNKITTEEYVVENPKDINIICKFDGRIMLGTFDMAFDARMMLAICDILGLEYIQFYASEMLYRPVVCQYKTECWGYVTALFQNLLRPEDKERMAECERISSDNPTATLWRLRGGKRGLVKLRKKAVDNPPTPTNDEEDEIIPF